MSPAYQSIKIFICSPGDVSKEREFAEKVILQVDNSCRDTLGLHVNCLKWEKMSPITKLLSEGGIQSDINNELIKQCNIFVVILNKRYGSTSPESDKSHSEEEIELALKMLKENRKITILSYFRNLTPNLDPGPQERNVRDLRERLERDGVHYKVYENPNDFQEKFTHDLYHTMLRFRMSTSKQKALRRFWNLGISEKQIAPALAIIYPPVNRSFMRQQNPDRYWLERLVPHVVFEDFKALQKIDKTLRLIGHSDIRTYTTFNYPQDIDDINRLWLCLPRNIYAQRQLELYQEDARFRVVPGKGTQPGFIQWKSSTGTYLTVHSPLSKYLVEQRSHMPGGEWHSQHGHIIAKDYAVLARFPDRDEFSPTISENKIKDYFLGGIRGLGTWGAGWFIDRRYNAFNRFEEIDDSPIQFLLEVTYINEHIFNVIDVSNEKQEYFNSQNTLTTIRKAIKVLEG